MKRKYDSPVLLVEEFSANSAVASCNAEGGIDYKFDCMAGRTVDIGRNVIAENLGEGTCRTNIGYAVGADTARDYAGSRNHSHNGSGVWTINGTGKNTYLQVTYAGAEGILYTDEGGNMSAWSIEGGIPTHASSGGGRHHNVAPVMDSSTISTSW